MRERRLNHAASGSDAAWWGGIVLVLLVGWALASIYQGGTRHDADGGAVGVLALFPEGIVAACRGIGWGKVGCNAGTRGARRGGAALQWVVTVLGWAGLLGIGLLATPALLPFARDPEDLSTRRGRLTFVGVTGIVAWLVGAILALRLLLPAPGRRRWICCPGAVSFSRSPSWRRWSRVI